MKKISAKYEDVWNMGFDFFFEKEEKNALWNTPRATAWNAGFQTAAAYCERLRMGKKETDI